MTINNARSSNTISFHSRLIKSGKDVLLVIPPEIVLQLNLKGNEDVTITTIGKRKIVIELI